MFVIGWGKKRQATRMGYAADFCPNLTCGESKAVRQRQTLDFPSFMYLLSDNVR